MDTINEINIGKFIEDIDQLEIEQKANILTREKLDKALKEKEEEIKKYRDDLEVVMKALNVLRQVSDEAVQNSYKFISDNINIALERIFEKSRRSIKLKEYTRGGMYPQLEIELEVENGKIRSLKEDSGHGIMQIISLLCILSLIAITGNRRILVIDEMLSGLSVKSRKTVDDILWAFTDIGFQFIISEHGYIPKGSKVYELEASGGTSKVVKEYIQKDGVYLTHNTGVDYKEISREREIEINKNVRLEINNGNIIDI